MPQENSTPEVETPINEAIELNPQEQKAIEDLREREAKKIACNKDLNALLDKYGATLGVNPNSTIANPQAIVLIK